MAIEKTFYVPIPEDEFYQRVGEAVYSVFMRRGFFPSNIKEGAKWLTHLEAAKYIRKTPEALYKLTSTRQIKYRKKGKTNIYKLEDLDTYLESDAIETAEEVIKGLALAPRKKHSITQK